jgi:hypothetical protein
MAGNVGLAYIYCNSQQRGLQTPENLAGCLVKQMALLQIRDGSLPQVLEDYYDANVGSGRPRLVGLSSVLHLICRMFSKAFIVVDGFDELAQDTQQVMVNEAKNFFKQSSARLLLSSRPHTSQLSYYLSSAFSLKITAQSADVRKFVKTRLRKNYKLQMIIAGDTRLTESVATEIANRSQGQ